MAASELDRKFDAVMSVITGPGGRVILDKDEQGRTVVANFPATLPLFFKTFCALYSDVEAVIAGEERLTFGELDKLSDQMARGFIIGLDLCYRKWGDMQRHLDLGGYPSLPRIREMAEKDPKGHITKWDVAECIYMLMTQPAVATAGATSTKDL